MSSAHPPPPPPPPSGPYYSPGQTYPAPNISHVEDNRFKQTPVRSPTELLWLSVTHNLTQIFLGGIIISALIIPSILSSAFLRPVKQHIVLNVVGYFVIIAQALLTFSPASWTITLDPERKRNIHICMQISGSILAITGSSIAVLNSGRLINTHSICGVIALAFTVVNLLMGILSYFLHGKMKGIMRLLPLFWSAATIAIAFLTLILGFNVYYREVAGDTNANLAISFSVFALIGVLLTPCIDTLRGRM